MSPWAWGLGGRRLEAPRVWCGWSGEPAHPSRAAGRYQSHGSSAWARDWTCSMSRSVCSRDNSRVARARQAAARPAHATTQPAHAAARARQAACHDRPSTPIHHPGRVAQKSTQLAYGPSHERHETAPSVRSCTARARNPTAPSGRSALPCPPGQRHGRRSARPQTRREPAVNGPSLWMSERGCPWLPSRFIWDSSAHSSWNRQRSKATSTTTSPTTTATPPTPGTLTRGRAPGDIVHSAYKKKPR